MAINDACWGRRAAQSREATLTRTCRRLRAFAAFSFLLATAATTKVAYDIYTWQMPSSIARQLALKAQTAHEQRAAIVALHQDARASIEVLRLIVDEGGPNAERARNALTYLHAKTGR